MPGQMDRSRAHSGSDAAVPSAGRVGRARGGGAGHGAEHWHLVVRELEASFQAVMLAKQDNTAGMRLLWLRQEGLSWAECLAALRHHQSLP